MAKGRSGVACPGPPVNCDHLSQPHSFSPTVKVQFRPAIWAKCSEVAKRRLQLTGSGSPHQEPKGWKDGNWGGGQWGAVCHIPLPKLKTLTADIYQVPAKGQGQRAPPSLHSLSASQSMQGGLRSSAHSFIHSFNEHLFSICYGPGAGLALQQRTKYPKIPVLVKLSFWWGEHSFFKYSYDMYQEKTLSTHVGTNV